MVVFMLNILSACSSPSNTATKTNADSKTLKNQTSSNNVLSNQSQGFSSSVSESTAQLTINHNCIGCGRCSLFDSEHFSRPRGGSIPDVISQNNLESSSLKKAIMACPVDAIDLG